MKIDLHYGRSSVSLEIPGENVEQVIRPWTSADRVDEAALIQEALAGGPTQRFREDITGRRVCVLLDDGTRDGPRQCLFENFFPLLKDAGETLFIICTGTHDADTAENRHIEAQVVDAASRARLGTFAVHSHDCQGDKFIDAGRTRRGTRVLFNERTASAEVFVVLSDMKTHYFAGYSNPVKNFVPGVCAFETAEQNHSLALDERATFGVHPWHSDAARRDNPVAADQVEAMRLIVGDRCVYALGELSNGGRIQWVRFGEVQAVCRAAFETIDRLNTHTVRRVPKLIVSPGGFPNDVNLYIAQRALELTKNAVADGGEILFIAACEQGIGEEKTVENFYNLLTDPLEDVLKSIQTKYKMYSHKPYKFAQLIKRLRRIWMHTEITDEQVEAVHLCPTDNPQAVVDGWLRQDPNTRISIVDGANKIALYADD